MSLLISWSFGTPGADLFFFISGFIIVVTTSGTDVQPLEFWRRRIIRVVPLYWVLTLVMVMVAFAAPQYCHSIRSRILIYPRKR